MENIWIQSFEGKQFKMRALWYDLKWGIYEVKCLFNWGWPNKGANICNMWEWLYIEVNIIIIEIRTHGLDAWMYQGYWRKLSSSIWSYCITHLYFHFGSCAPHAYIMYIVCTLVYYDIWSIWYITMVFHNPLHVAYVFLLH